MRHLLSFSTTLLAALALAVLCAAPTPCPAQDAVPNAALHADVAIDLDTRSGTFSTLLLGNNLQWTNNGDGLYSEAAQGLDQALVERLRALPVPVLRFPGGAMAGTYVWTNGLGPQQDRGQGLDFSGNAQPMRFGTDEFLDLLAALDAQGMITLNTNAEANEAAAWLRYVRARPGVPVPYWEIGNEPYLSLDPATLSAAAYTDRVLALNRALKAEAPDVHTGAAILVGYDDLSWITSVIPEARTWNQTVLAATAGQVDFYSAHFYAPYASQDDEQAVRAMLAGPVQFERSLVRERERIAQAAPGAEIWVTEYNVLADTAMGNWRLGTSAAQVSYLAQMLMAFARQGVAGANYWSLLGNDNFGMIKSAADPVPRPSGAFFTHAAWLAGAPLLATSVDADQVAVPPLGNVEHLGHVDALDAQAFLTGDEVWLLLANRDPVRAVDVRLSCGSAAVSGLEGWLFAAGHFMDSFEDQQYEPAPVETTGGSLVLPGGAAAMVLLTVVRP